MARTKGAKDKTPRKNAKIPKPPGKAGRPREAPIKPKRPEPPMLVGKHKPLPPPKGPPAPGQTVAWARVVKNISSQKAAEIKILPTDTAKEVAVKSAMVAAMKGNLRALEWLANREEGSPVQPTTIGNPDGSPLVPDQINIATLPDEDLATLRAIRAKAAAAAAK